MHDAAIHKCYAFMTLTLQQSSNDSRISPNPCHSSSTREIACIASCVIARFTGSICIASAVRLLDGLFVMAPAQQQVVHVTGSGQDYHEVLKIATAPVVEPQQGEVLVRVVMRPINPVWTFCTQDDTVLHLHLRFRHPTATCNACRKDQHVVHTLT